MELSLATRPGRGCLVVQLGGVLDLASIPDVRSRLQQALDDGVRNVVLDLAEVRLIDSTALGMIVWLHKELLERGGRACVAAAPGGPLRSTPPDPTSRSTSRRSLPLRSTTRPSGP